MDVNGGRGKKKLFWTGMIVRRSKAGKNEDISTEANSTKRTSTGKEEFWVDGRAFVNGQRE